MFEVCHKITLPLFLGLGKTPACKIVCVEPVINHLEQRLETSDFLIDEASENGLFNLISTKDNFAGKHNSHTNSQIGYLSCLLYNVSP